MVGPWQSSPQPAFILFCFLNSIYTYKCGVGDGRVELIPALQCICLFFHFFGFLNSKVNASCRLRVMEFQFYINICYVIIVTFKHYLLLKQLHLKHFAFIDYDFTPSICIYFIIVSNLYSYILYFEGPMEE